MSLCSAGHVKTRCIASSLMVGRNVTAWGVDIRESLRAFASLQLQVGVDLLTHWLTSRHTDFCSFDMVPMQGNHGRQTHVHIK